MFKSPVINFVVIIFTLAYASPVQAATKLNVPYTSQSPAGDWREPWQDACEEASIAMVDGYYRHQTLNKTVAKQSILNIIALEQKTFQHSKDTTANETALIINNFLRWETTKMSDPSVDDIRSELDAGRPVIAPVFGRGLRNPFFRSGGPDYHMIVITGYDNNKQEFITNEPGINHGLDFRYSYGTIMDAIHDFVPGKKTSTGAKVVLFTSPDISTSSETDGDKDGATKADEIHKGSSLQNTDTDHDGFSDGMEIANGYSPTTDERKLSDGSLIKTVDDTDVYVYHNKTKQPIASEEVLIQHSWKFSNVKIVGRTFLEKLVEGEKIEN